MHFNFVFRLFLVCVVILCDIVRYHVVSAAKTSFCCWCQACEVFQWSPSRTNWKNLS